MSSITEAMRRVQPGPLRALFDLIKGTVATVATSGVAKLTGRHLAAALSTVTTSVDKIQNMSIDLQDEVNRY